MRKVAGNEKPGFVDGDSMSAQFNNPRGIAVMADGNIIVADTGNRAIREVASNGSIKTLVLYDKKGRKFEGFKEPTDVAVDAEGRIVVADSKARRLWVIENGVAKVLWKTQRKDCAHVSLAIPRGQGDFPAKSNGRLPHEARDQANCPWS